MIVHLFNPELALITKEDGLLGRNILKFLKAGIDVNIKGRFGVTPLLLATRKGHLDIVKKLVQKGADVNIATKSNYTPLFSASALGHFEIAKFLVLKGANVNVADSFTKTTPLHLAVENERHDLCKLLIDNVKNSNKKTPYDMAIKLKFDTIVQLFDGNPKEVTKEATKEKKIAKEIPDEKTTITKGSTTRRRRKA